MLSLQTLHLLGMVGTPTSADGSMPVLTTSAPMSASTQSIWLRSVSTGTVWKPCTPACHGASSSVACAVHQTSGQLVKLLNLSVRSTQTAQVLGSGA